MRSKVTSNWVNVLIPPLLHRDKCKRVSSSCSEMWVWFAVALRGGKKRDLPLVKVQQLSRFLAFGLGLHYIPVFPTHTPPCGWILTGKQSTHGSRGLTPPSPANTDNQQRIKPLFYRTGLQKYAIKHEWFSHLKLPRFDSIKASVWRAPETKTKPTNSWMKRSGVTVLPLWDTEISRDDRAKKKKNTTSGAASSEQQFQKVCPLKYFVLDFV